MQHWTDIQHHRRICLPEDPKIYLATSTIRISHCQLHQIRRVPHNCHPQPISLITCDDILSHLGWTSSSVEEQINVIRWTRTHPVKLNGIPTTQDEPSAADDV
jgi:hypothetical protein